MYMRIPFLLFAFLTMLPLAHLAAQSIMPSPDQTKAAFTAEQLSSLQLDAFEQKAQQLVQDYFDYYQLLQTTELDTQLRETVISAIQQLFHSSTDSLYMSQPLALAQLQAVDFTHLPKLTLGSFNLVTISPIGLGQEWEYQLTFSNNQNRRGMAIVRLYQRTKMFGSTQQKVWDVQLRIMDVR